MPALAVCAEDEGPRAEDGGRREEGGREEGGGMKDGGRRAEDELLIATD